MNRFISATEEFYIALLYRTNCGIEFNLAGPQAGVIMKHDSGFRLSDELSSAEPLPGRKKPPVKPPPRKRKRPPVEEPNDEPSRGDPKPKKKTPIGDPPAERRRRRLSAADRGAVPK